MENENDTVEIVPENETKAQKLDRLRNKHKVQTVTQADVDPETGLTWSDAGRLAATGLLFNYADEAIAGIKSLSPNVTYKDALTEERDILKKATAYFARDAKCEVRVHQGAQVIFFDPVYVSCSESSLQ